MANIHSISDLSGLDLTKEGWSVAVVRSVYFHAGTGVCVVGYYRDKWAANTATAKHPLRDHLKEMACPALVNIEGGFILASGVKFVFEDAKVLSLGAPSHAENPPAVVHEKDDYVPRHPYHRYDEGEGPDPSTHPSWNN
jgi:hypothetical protein